MPKTVTFDREKVLRDVTELFWKKGYHGTSMQDLVDATGLNRSSLYNSFGDKFSLFEEALKRYQINQNEFLTEALASHQSPKEALISLFRGISSDIQHGDQKGCFLTNCTTELSVESPQVKHFLVQNKDRVVGTFEELIQEAQTRGEMDKGRDPKIIALFLFSSLQGLRVTSMIEPHLQAVTEEMLQIL